MAFLLTGPRSNAIGVVFMTCLLARCSRGRHERTMTGRTLWAARMAGAGGGNRTHTGREALGILSPARLPISPLRRARRVYAERPRRVGALTLVPARLSYPARHAPGLAGAPRVLPRAPGQVLPERRRGLAHAAARTRGCRQLLPRAGAGRGRALGALAREARGDPGPGGALHRRRGRRDRLRPQYLDGHQPDR